MAPRARKGSATTPKPHKAKAKTPRAPRRAKPVAVDPDELTEKERVFVDEYPRDRNAARAARRAGYSESSAREIGYAVLNRPRVRALIDKAIRDRSARTNITEDRVLLGLVESAEYDIADAFDEVGKLLPLDQMPRDVRDAIISVEVEDIFEGHGKDRERIGELTKVKFQPRLAPREILAKYLKLLGPTPEDVGKSVYEAIVAASWQPVDSESIAVPGTQVQPRIRS